MTVIRKPCPTCPWRLDQDASVIPNFRLELAERLAGTSPDERGMGPELGAAQFACHQSKEDPVVCAGWLAVHGSAHPAVRIKVIEGEVPVEALRPGDDWPELEPDFQAVIEKLRRTA